MPSVIEIHSTIAPIFGGVATSRDEHNDRGAGGEVHLKTPVISAIYRRDGYTTEAFSGHGIEMVGDDFRFNGRLGAENTAADVERLGWRGHVNASVYENQDCDEDGLAYHDCPTPFSEYICKNMYPCPEGREITRLYDVGHRLDTSGDFDIR